MQRMLMGILPSLLCSLVVLGATLCVTVAGEQEEWVAVDQLLLTMETGTRDEKLAAIDSFLEGGSPWEVLLGGSDGPRFYGLIGHLVATISREADPWVRYRASVLVMDWWSWSDDPMPSMIAGLIYHPDPNVRRQVVEPVYMEFDDDALIDAILISVASSEPEVGLRAAEVDGISEFDAELIELACRPALTSVYVEDVLSGLSCISYSAPRVEGWVDEIAAFVKHSFLGVRVSAINLLFGVHPKLDPAMVNRIRRTLEHAWNEKSSLAETSSLLPALARYQSGIAHDEARRLIWVDDIERVKLGISVLTDYYSEETFDELLRRSLIGDTGYRIAAIHVLPQLARNIHQGETCVDQRRRIDELATSLLAHGEIDVVRAAIGVSSELVWIHCEGVPPAATMARQAKYRESFSQLITRDLDSLVTAIAQSLVNSMDGNRTSFYFNSVCGIANPLVSLIVNSANGQQSVRCHRSPFDEYAPDDSIRLISGSDFQSFSMNDPYVEGGRRWIHGDVDLDDEQSISCWLPRDDLEYVDGDDSLNEVVLAVDDLDLPLTESSLAMLDELERAGVVETFDVGRTVIGVRVLLDGTNARQLSAIVRSGDQIEARLGDAIHRRLATSFGGTHFIERWAAWRATGMR